MKMLSGILLLVLFSVPSFSNEEKSPRLLRHLLDYIALDYSGAVENGKVVSAAEYQEQIEFVNTTLGIAASLPEIKDDAEITRELQGLKELMLRKGAPGEVAEKSRRIGNRVIQISKMEVSPNRWPDLHQGKVVYEKNCTACHGPTGHGDGPSSGSLDPKPSDFHSEKVDGLPPFQMFNTIRLGVPGTAMAGFHALSDQEVWDVAFYALSLRHGNPEHHQPSNLTTPTWTVKEAATKSDMELRALVAGNEVEKRTKVSELRLHTQSHDSDENYLRVAEEQLNLVLSSYRDGKFTEAKNHAILAYLENVEPIEAKLRARDSRLTQELESRMTLVRAAIDSKTSSEVLEEKVRDAQTYLKKSKDVLTQEESSPWFTFTVASGIFLREAFEAALILITLLGVIRSVGSSQGALYVHIGWISAVGVGLLAWFFSGWLVQISGAQRELLEGVISLFAVIVLLYFGFWLHRKTEIGKWQTFIREMVTAAIDKKNLMALGGVAFMGVFREAFETVLFLRALLIETGPGQTWAMAAGVLSSFILVLALATLIVRYSAKIPVRRLFMVSSVVMVMLSFVLIGKAVHSFQETGLVGITPFPLTLRSELFGIYPTYETFVPQFLILLAVPIVLVLGKTLYFGSKNATH